MNSQFSSLGIFIDRTRQSLGLELAPLLAASGLDAKRYYRLLHGKMY